MTLAAGIRLGPYRILEKLGEGGMGEVYKARDTRLDRSVAIKVLPPDLSADPDRRARFEREAKTIAGLSHPHICALYDVGRETPTGGEGVGAAPSLPRAQALDSARAESRGGRPIDGASAGSEGVGAAPCGRPIDFLVMEYLEGETLADRLARRKGSSAQGGHGGPPLRVEEALAIATDIADALAAAHRQGVIHRDLKPANVMLTRGGAVRLGPPHAKLLDFGLAKLTGHGEQPAAASLASAPTRTSPLTAEGTIVGTLQYMAPEQVEGKPADARTDLWALGAILYEMLTGKRAFEGASAASLIGNIMNAEPPPPSTLVPLTPPALDRLVRRCLAKDPDERWASARDVADEIRWVRDGAGAGTPAVAQPRRPRRWRAALVAAGLVVAAALGAAATWILRPGAPPPAAARVSLDVRPADELNGGGHRPILRPTAIWTPGGTHTALAWAPDGRTLVFVGRRAGLQQLYVRRLDAAEARPLPDTDGALAPAISPDGQWVAFWTGGRIRKVRLEGGAAVDVAAGLSNPPGGLAWDEAGRLYLGAAYIGGGIRVIEPGGAPADATKPGESELIHVLPLPLPGARAILYTVRKRQMSWGDEELVARTLATGERKVLVRDAADGRYVATGHLLFMRRGVLLAVAFDAARLEVRGTPVPVLDAVAQALTGNNTYHMTGAGQFAVSTTGALAWVPSPVVPYPDASLVTVDRQGRVAPLPAAPRAFHNRVSVSPDGRRLAVSIRSLSDVGLAVYDVDRGTLTPLVRGGEATWPVWSPDGRRLAFRWIADGRPSLATEVADGTAPPEVLAPGTALPTWVSSDGRQAMAVTTPAYHVVTLTRENGLAREERVLQTSGFDGWPAISPDGRWLAYASDASGRSEVYVRPYPGAGPATPVSIDGGSSPAWNPNGRELFFIGAADPAGRDRMMAVDVTPGPGAAVPPGIGRPRVLFDFDNRDLNMAALPARCFDVAPGGLGFFALRYGPPSPPPVVTHVNLILNWFEELRAKVPIK
jgi:eukaryotic-like serine/threonine-protein kinase